MQKIRFLLGGAVGVSLYYATLYILTEKMRIWYVASATVAFVLNWNANFIIQKYWTFENRDHNATRNQAIKYFTMALGLLITNNGLLYLLVEYVGLWYITAQIVLTIVLTIVSFIITRRIFT